MIEWVAALAIQAGGFQVDPRLDAFRQACTPHRRDYDRTIAHLAESGWVEVPIDDHPELAASTAIGMAIADEPGLEMETRFSTWRREIEDRTLYVVASRIDSVIGETRDDDGDGDGEIQDWERAWTLTFLGCGLWDFEATEPMSPGQITAWTASMPVQSFEEAGVIQGATWNVSTLMPGSAEVHMGFIPEASPMVARTGFSGLSITMSSAPEGED